VSGGASWRNRAPLQNSHTQNAAKAAQASSYLQAPSGGGVARVEPDAVERQGRQQPRAAVDEVVGDRQRTRAGADERDVDVEDEAHRPPRGDSAAGVVKAGGTESTGIRGRGHAVKDATIRSGRPLR
jgi:hypothetical protein